MATRRRIGVSLATTEAARRALMQPVPCWEKVWSAPENAGPGSTLRVYKWVKTDKQQQFSDDEDEVDVPLAPLPDEIEVVDGDEEDQEQDEAAVPADRESATQPPDTTAANTEAQPTPAQPLSPAIVPHSPSPPPENPQLLSLQPDENAVDESHDVLDASLKPLDASLVDASLVDTSMDGVTNMDDGVDVGVDVDVVGHMDPDGGLPENMVGDIDMSGLGPDGMAFEGAHDLNQIESGDDILGGPVMDDSVDAFAGQELADIPTAPPEHE